MKYLRFLLLAIMVMFTFGSAMAQVIVRARVGGPVHHRYYHRHWHHRHWHHR